MAVCRAGLAEKEEDICKISVKNKSEDGDCGETVRSDNLVFEVRSQVPVTKLCWNGQTLVSDVKIYCLPFGTEVTLCFQMTVNMSKISTNYERCMEEEGAEVQVVTLFENVPHALWGKEPCDSPAPEYIDEYKLAVQTRSGFGAIRAGRAKITQLTLIDRY